MNTGSNPTQLTNFNACFEGTIVLPPSSPVGDIDTLLLPEHLEAIERDLVLHNITQNAEREVFLAGIRAVVARLVDLLVDTVALPRLSRRPIFFIWARAFANFPTLVERTFSSVKHLVREHAINLTIMRHVKEIVLKIVQAAVNQFRAHTLTSGPV